MKTVSLFYSKVFLPLFFLFAFIGMANAQPGDPAGDPDVPITGIEILIGAGGALGIKKMLDKRKKTT
jgi:hypothetical protein